jgi:hypothetical protein
MFPRTRAADSLPLLVATVLFVLLEALGGPDAGAVIYADGGSHLLSGSEQEQVFVQSGTTLEIGAGASVQPLLNGTAVLGASGSTILVSGGLLQGTGGSVGAGGLSSSFCQVEVQPGAEIRAAYSTSTYTSSALYFIGGDPAYSCRISGGLIAGGGTADHGCFGVFVRGTLELSGGTIEGGDALDGSGGIALEYAEGVGTISGGSLQGGMGQTTGGDALHLSGGSLTISDGRFEGGTSTGSAAGGRALCIDEQAQVFIEGGHFVAGSSSSSPLVCIAAFKLSQISLSGGDCMGQIVLQGSSRLTVIGHQLALQGSQERGVENQLTGTLSDGTPIDLIVVLYDGARVILQNQVAVEPTSIGQLKARFGTR